MTVRVRGCIRVGAALLSLVLLAACTIDLVDTPDTPGAPIAGPSPVRFQVLAKVLSEPDTEPARVSLSVWLMTGVAEDGTPRELETNILRVGDRIRRPSEEPSGPWQPYRWDTVLDYPPPVPELITVRAPAFVGSDEALAVRIPLAFELTPVGRITLSLTDDLVLQTPPPDHVTSATSWRLVLGSTAESPEERFELNISGEGWPSDIRVPAEMMPDVPGQLGVTLQIAMPLDSSALDVPQSSDAEVGARLEIEHTRVIDRVSAASP